MARRRYRKKSKRRSSSNILVVILTLLIMAAAGFFMWFWYVSQNKELLDKATLCPELGPKSHLAILIDTTDPVTLTQLQAAKQHIYNKVENSEVGTRISLSVVSPDYEIRQHSYYSICKPPSGDDASYLTENPRLIQQRYEERFEEPFVKVLNSLLVIEEAESSPIMESLQEMITKIPKFTISESPREMIILSDLVQHSGIFSFYRGHDWKYFKEKDGPNKLSKNLNGVKLTLLRIPRGSVSLADVDDFWTRYFDAQGFSDINVTTIGDI